jgi:AcrR family transcriptional regulator
VGRAKRGPVSVAEPPLPGKRKRRSPGEIMQRLLKAAEEEFKACGYMGGTTAAIARRAEVTEAQLFRYFPSKAALFRRAMVTPLDDHLQAFLTRRNGSVRDPEHFRANARAYITELQDFISEHEKMFLSLVTIEAYSRAGIEGLTGVDSLHEYFEHGAQSLGVHDGEHRAVDPRLMVRTSFAAVLACVIFRDWLFPEGFADDRAIREAVIHLVLYGIHGTPPPR